MKKIFFLLLLLFNFSFSVSYDPKCIGIFCTLRSDDYTYSFLSKYLTNYNSVSTIPSSIVVNDYSTYSYTDLKSYKIGDNYYRIGNDIYKIELAPQETEYHVFLYGANIPSKRIISNIPKTFFVPSGSKSIIVASKESSKLIFYKFILKKPVRGITNHGKFNSFGCESDPDGTVSPDFISLGDSIDSVVKQMGLDTLPYNKCYVHNYSLYIYKRYVLNKINTCSDTQHFNPETGECFSCSDGLYWEPSIGKCTNQCDLIVNQGRRFDCTCRENNLGSLSHYVSLLGKSGDHISQILNSVHTSKTDGKVYTSRDSACVIECTLGSIGIKNDHETYCFDSDDDSLIPFDPNETKPNEPKLEPVEPDNTIDLRKSSTDNTYRPHKDSTGRIQTNPDKSLSNTDIQHNLNVDITKDDKGNFKINFDYKGKDYTAQMDTLIDYLAMIEKNTRENGSSDSNDSKPGNSGDNNDTSSIKGLDDNSSSLSDGYNFFKKQNKDFLDKFDKINEDGVSFLSKSKDFLEEFKTSFNDLILTIKNPLTPVKSSSSNSCPFKKDFSIGSGFSVPLDFDICSLVGPLSNIFYLVFFSLFFLVFLKLLYKFILKVVL